MISQPNEFIFPRALVLVRRERSWLWNLLRLMVALVIRGLLRLYLRFEIRGAAHLPNDGSFVLVANHCSHLDALCLLAALPWRRLARAYTVAAEDYFFQSRTRRWIAAATANALPFTRGRGLRESLATCAEVLATPGTVLILFPEGTRSRSGELQPFRSGIGALVGKRDLPVLPCHLAGTHRAWPKGQRLPWPAKVRLTIGAPRRYRADKNQIAAELQQAVEELAHDRD